MQKRTQVTQQDFEKYGDNPANHPNLAPLIENAINAKSPLDTSDLKATDSDLLDQVTICGKTCRAISAGDVSLFERVQNPLFDGTTLEATLADFMEVLYVLTNDDIPGMVRTSMDLKEWKIAVEIYAMGIQIEELKESIDQIEELITEASTEMSDVEGSEDDEDSKKKPIG